MRRIANAVVPLALAIGCASAAANTSKRTLPQDFKGAVEVKLENGWRADCALNHDNPHLNVLDYLMFERDLSQTTAMVQVLRSTPNLAEIGENFREQEIGQDSKCSELKLEKRDGRRKIVGRYECRDLKEERLLDTKMALLELPEFPSGVAVISVSFKRGEDAGASKLLGDIVQSLRLVPYDSASHPRGK